MLGGAGGTEGLQTVTFAFLVFFSTLKWHGVC